MERVFAIATAATAVAITVSFLGGCASGPAPVQAADPAMGRKGIEVADLNRGADACGDFYEYANGAWRAQNPIPAGKQRWSRRVAAQEANRQRILDILLGASRQSNLPAGSAERVLGDFFASCMDESAADAAGLKPLAPLLAEIDAIHDAASLQAAIRRVQEHAVGVPFVFSSTPDYHQPTRTIANIAAGTLGLPDRDHYLKDEPRFVEARAKYITQVADVLILAGTRAPQAAEAAGHIFALEKRLAEASLDGGDAADPAKTDHIVSFPQLVDQSPHIDWARYFDEAGMPHGDVNIAEPRNLRQLDKELAETPLPVWAAYLKWQLLDSASPFLSRPFAAAHTRFHQFYLEKASAAKPRTQFCAESAEALLGDALGKAYAERYFSPAAKAKVFEIARSLMAALKDDVAKVAWMQPETKKIALQKLTDTDFQLGYPDQWKNYASLALRRDTPWANVAAARKFGVDEDRAWIGKPTRRDLWPLSPASAAGAIDLQLNKVILPAGFLQPPYFNPEANDAVNYGALGIGLAHDLTHAIDFGGADTDPQGRPVNWWTEADRKGFEQRAQCVVDQFEGYYVEPGLHHNGKLVRSESVADLAGERIAWLAFQNSMRLHPVARVDGFTPEQQFFIAWVQTSGTAMTIEAQRTLVKGDPHPVPSFRILSQFSNSPEFQQTFSCKAGAGMVLPPGKRCAVW